MIESLTLFISSFGYLAIFLIMLLNSDFFPLFTEVTLPFAGFLASKSILSVGLIILASVLGDLLGGTIAYYIGHFLEDAVIIKLINKYGKYILLKERNYLETVNLVQKRGAPIVFFAKLIPGLKTWTSVASGICNIKFKKYILASCFASIIYNSALVLLGYLLGKNWVIIGMYVKRMELFVLFGLLIGILLFAIYRFKLIKPRK